MDPYALKQDNRNRFKEKQRAKQRHATPSDRKYRALKRQEQASNEAAEEEVQEPPSNEYRYHEDVTMAYGQMQDEERNADANRKVKQALEGRGEDLDIESEHLDRRADTFTKKELDRMDVHGLNNVLGRQKTTGSVGGPSSPAAGSSAPSSREVGKPQAKGAPPSQPTTSSKPSMSSTVPEDLEADQEFLDGLL